ncbi:glycosyltransferase family 2 protein [Candidatus Saccharibacteria bacterium]|nr:glycosyltransferase family 2 protein [Candidatus Saccharibacteria bacterium]
MDKPTISIIIPVYNEERHLAACLDAIAAQTIAPAEVLLVDNNSTDRTVEIAGRYSFVKVLTEPRQGTVFARNAGFNTANGEWLARIDADTVIDRDWTEKLGELILQGSDAVAITGSGSFYDVPFSRFFSVMQIIGYQMLQWPAMRGWTLWGANMAVRRDVWLKVGRNCHARTDIDEDVDLTLALRQQKNRVILTFKLPARMALQRNRTLSQTLRYVTTWPKDYWVTGNYVSALYISFATIIVMLFTCLTWPIGMLSRSTPDL